MSGSVGDGECARQHTWSHRQGRPECRLARVKPVPVDPDAKLCIDRAKCAGPFRKPAEPVYSDVGERRDKETGIGRVCDGDVVLHLLAVDSNAQIAAERRKALAGDLVVKERCIVGAGAGRREKLSIR